MSTSPRKATPPRKPRFSFSLSPRAVTLAMVLCVTFITGGGIYDLINRPDSSTYNPYTGENTFISLFGEQTLTESFVSMLLTLMTFGGLYVTYKAIQSDSDKSQVNTRIWLGTSLFVVAIIVSYYLASVKSGYL